MKAKEFAKRHKKTIVKAGIIAGVATVGYAYIRGRSSVPLTGTATFADGRVVYDEDVYKAVKASTKLVDRLNTRKIVELALVKFAEMAPDPKTVSETVQAAETVVENI